MEPLSNAISKIFGKQEDKPRKNKYGMIKSNAPRQQKERTRTAKPRKPVPKGRAELVARQKRPDRRI